MNRRNAAPGQRPAASAAVRVLTVSEIIEAELTISPDPSFTSRQRATCRAARGLLAAAVVVCLHPLPSGGLAALLAAQC
jgi:hypothetical protein